MDTDSSVVIAGHSELKMRVNALMPRQSILFAKRGLTKMMDPRVKPAGDVPVGPVDGLDPAIHPLQ